MEGEHGDNQQQHMGQMQQQMEIADPHGPEFIENFNNFQNDMGGDCHVGMFS